MRGPGRKILLASSAILCAAGSLPATAQDAARADDPEAIIVTARRSEERLQDVPISITVFNQQQLANRNIFNAGDLGTYTPSLSTNSRFGPEKSSFAIRGFTQENGTAPSVGVYFAEVVAPRAAGGTASGNGAGVGSFFDLANVQVLKGPQGTLFGRNTTGGAILLVPNRPTDALEGYVEGTVGNFDAKRVQAVVNLPVNDTFKVRLGVDRNKRDGYQINHSRIGPGRFSDTDYLAARLSVIADLTPDLENYTIAFYSKSDTAGSIARIVACDRASPSPFARAGCAQFDRQAARGDDLLDVENGASDAYTHLTQWGVINTTTWQASDTLVIKNIASYAEFYERTSQNIDGDNFTVPSGFGPISGLPFQLIITRNAPHQRNAAQSTFTEELQIHGHTPDGRLDWQTGAYFEVSDPLGPSQTYTPVLLACSDIYAFRCASYFGASTGAMSSASFKTSFRDLGLYAQGSYKITDALSLTGGIRYTRDRSRQTGENISVKFLNGANQPGFYCNNKLLFPGPALPGLPLGNGKQIGSAGERSLCSATFRAKSSRPTWLIDLDYKPGDDLLLYGKYARGYRAGGINTNAIGYETWGPEKVDSFELGLKASFAGALRGYLNVAAFYNKFQDQQIQANATAKLGSGISGANVIVNAGSSVIYGAEVDASISPFRGLRLDAAYAYLHTELKSLSLPAIDPNSPYAAITPTAKVGGPLGYSPKHRVTVTAIYTLPLPETIGELSFGATYTHTDRQIASLSTLLQYGILPASDLLNLNVNWNGIAGLPVDVALFATNVTKEVFPVAVSNAYNSFGFESQYFNEPRMYGARLKYRF